jgi:hypothetical protein
MTGKSSRLLIYPSPVNAELLSLTLTLPHILLVLACWEWNPGPREDGTRAR